MSLSSALHTPPEASDDAQQICQLELYIDFNGEYNDADRANYFDELERTLVLWVLGRSVYSHCAKQPKRCVEFMKTDYMRVA